MLDSWCFHYGKAPQQKQELTFHFSAFSAPAMMLLTTEGMLIQLEGSAGKCRCAVSACIAQHA